jgi:hypothetical protein
MYRRWRGDFITAEESQMALTARRVTGLINKGNSCKVNDGRGLYLIVEGKTSASWAFRYALNQHKHWMGIGSAFIFGGT